MGAATSTDTRPPGPPQGRATDEINRQARRRRRRRRVLGPEPGPQLPGQLRTGTSSPCATSTRPGREQVLGAAERRRRSATVARRRCWRATTSTRSRSRRRRARTVPIAMAALRGRQARPGREAAGARAGRGRAHGRRGADERGLVLMCDHTYCYTPGRAADPRARRAAASSATSCSSTRCGSTSGWCSPTSTSSGTSPRTTCRSSTSSCPAACGRTAVAAHGADPIGAGKACVGYLTLPLAGGAIAHVHVNWLSPTKIRQMVIGGSPPHRWSGTT